MQIKNTIKQKNQRKRNIYKPFRYIQNQNNHLDELTLWREIGFLAMELTLYNVYTYHEIMFSLRKHYNSHSIFQKVSFAEFISIYRRVYYCRQVFGSYIKGLGSNRFKEKFLKRRFFLNLLFAYKWSGYNEIPQDFCNKYKKSGFHGLPSQFNPYYGNSKIILKDTLLLPKNWLARFLFMYLNYNDTLITHVCKLNYNNNYYWPFCLWELDQEYKDFSFSFKVEWYSDFNGKWYKFNGDFSHKFYFYFPRQGINHIFTTIDIFWCPEELLDFKDWTFEEGPDQWPPIETGFIWYDCLRYDYLNDVDW